MYEMVKLDNQKDSLFFRRVKMRETEMKTLLASVNNQALPSFQVHVVVVSNTATPLLLLHYIPQSELTHGMQ